MYTPNPKIRTPNALKSGIFIDTRSSYVPQDSFKFVALLPLFSRKLSALKKSLKFKKKWILGYFTSLIFIKEALIFYLLAASTSTCQAFRAQVCCAWALARRVRGEESRDSLSPAGRTSLGEGADARGSLRAVPTSAQAGSPGVWPSVGDLERN